MIECFNDEEVKASLLKKPFKKALLSPLHHEGANTIFLTNKKLSLDKRLVYCRP